MWTFGGVNVWSYSGTRPIDRDRSTINPPCMEPCLFVLVGATGDLARRKLIPALYRGLLSRESAEDVVVLGAARSDWSDDDLRDAFRESLKEDGLDAAAVDAWCDRCIAYQHVGDDGELDPVFGRAAELEEERGLPGNRVYYLAVPPSVFEKSIREIGEHEREHGRDGWTRIVIEKPFGHDLESAQALNRLVHEYFDEHQVYRIDHYLGKETVQNLLVFRFANPVFEAVWNREHVERVEITVAESLGVEGRAGYYDRSGALRDMVQNHLTQLLTLTAMEPPPRFDADAVRQEKLKVLLSTAPVEPDDVVLGRYTAGDDDEGYLEHDDVPAVSTTETFAALRVTVDNWRWQGVPFLLRTGKRMPEKLTEIAVYFRVPPVQFFGGPDHCSISRNVLRIRLQPDESVQLGFEVKQPGEGFDLSSQTLTFDYADVFGEPPGAYETLLVDVVEGDQTLFVHADETEAAWALYQPLLDADLPVLDYESGSWGPEAAARMFFADRRAQTTVAV